MKNITLAVIAITPSIAKGSREITGYVIKTEESKHNPYTNGTIKVSVGHMKNIAQKLSAGLRSLCMAVNLGGCTVSVDTNGTHAKGDVILDKDGSPILAIGDQESDADGNRVFTQDGVNIDTLSLNLQLSTKATRELMYVADMVEAESSRPASVATEVAAPVEAEKIG